MENKEGVKTFIDSQVVITGTIRSAGSIRIDGKLEGDLICEADAVIGKDATITGSMDVNSISVEGLINGNITALDRIEMKSTARILGDIKSKRLTVEDGVTFIGRSEVNPSGAPIPAAGGPRGGKPEGDGKAPLPGGKPEGSGKSEGGSPPSGNLKK